MNARDLRLLSITLEIAARKRFNDVRNFRIAALGVRSDGAIVTATNGAVLQTGVMKYNSFPRAHAEARLSRKLDVGSVVYVARASKLHGHGVLAKPCPTCKQFLVSRGCQRVVYTTYDGVAEEFLT
jgi:hypothetical protein